QSLVGNHSLRVYANDTKNSIDHYDFMLEIIDTPSPPNITSIAIENNMLKVNLSYSVYVYASDEDGNIVGFNDNTSLFNISTVDTGSYNTSAIGEISFTPDTIGYYEVNISVNDSTDLFDYFVLSFNVTENHPPVFTQISNITCEEDELCEYQVLADDPDWQDNITFGDNTTEFDIDSETGLISFIPPLNANYNVTLWVHDGTINTTEVIWVNITEINDPPVFTENITNISFWDNIFEEQFSEVHLNASDEENDSISLNVQFFNFTDLGNNVYTENISLFNFTRVVTNPDNTVTGTINFTPRSNQVGEYWVNISASDGNDTTSIVFNFTVQNQNDLPIFNWSMNYSYGGVFLQGNESDDYNYFNCQENRSVYFTVDAFDPDFDTINYTWYREKDGITSLFYHSIHGDYNYTIPFNASPQETIILSVYDGISSVNISWQLSAENVNRPIVFGKKHYDFIQGSGVYNGTKLTDGNLMLLNSSPSVFFSNGSFTSDYIDFRSSSYGIDRIDYRTISYDNSDNSSGYDVYVYTDTTRQATETPSFSLYDGEEISTEDYRYFWFKLQVNSTNNTATPVISGVDMTYDIHDLQVSANTQYAGWIDLDNFFIDPDKDDNVTYSHRFIQGANLVTVSYASGSYVGLDFNNAGTASLIFTATDEHNSSTDSNLITIEIQSDGEDSTDSTSTSTTSSGTSYRTRVETETIFEYKTKEEPVALDIIHPQEVTIYDDETIEIPITLQNNEKFDLMGLSINATSDRGNYPVTIDKSEIELLGRDQSSEILLKMNVSDIYDSFGVIVNVSVADPLYSDSAKIMVTSLKRASSDDNAETLKLSFVSDLLSKNEECAELSEYVDRAKHYIESEELDKASQTLDNFINDCKLLIKYSDNEEMITGNIMDRTIDKIKTSNEYLMLAVSIGVIFFITIVMSLVTIYRKI
ncbi:MAG: cadherin repeat domain-containing protein, partial [Candidatus Woesearchaeota archaeon]